MTLEVRYRRQNPLPNFVICGACLRTRLRSRIRLGPVELWLVQMFPRLRRKREDLDQERMFFFADE